MEGGGGGGGGGRLPRAVPLDLSLELTDLHIIKAVFIRVPEHWKSDTGKNQREFFLFSKAEWITSQKFSELKSLQ